MPQFPIHHDVRVPHPAGTSQPLRVVEQVARLAPQTLRGLTYFFDPAEILRPCFYRVFRIEESLYLFPPAGPHDAGGREHGIERGTNDTTPCTRPGAVRGEQRGAAGRGGQGGREGDGIPVNETISQTWIGEQGRGYFVQGIWMDADLTKFFSRLFLPRARGPIPTTRSCASTRQSATP